MAAGYCEEMRRLEEAARESIRRDVEGAGGKVSFTAECEEGRTMYAIVRLKPTRFATPPELRVRCEDSSCLAELHVRTTAARAEEIAKWSREKGVLAGRCFFIPNLSCYPPGGVVLSKHAEIKDVDRAAEELVRGFREAFDRG